MIGPPPLIIDMITLYDDPYTLYRIAVGSGAKEIHLDSEAFEELLGALKEHLRKTGDSHEVLDLAEYELTEFLFYGCRIVRAV